MVGIESDKQYYISKKANLKELFGFLWCKIPDPCRQLLGLLPVKTKTGIVFPMGEWSGMYFSEQLKYSVENGSDINIKWRYKFIRVNNVFTNYVKNFYTIKSHPKNITQKI